MSLPIEVYTPDEIKALKGACSRRAPTGIRNRALIDTNYRGGLRVSELLNLYPKDIQGNELHVLSGKGGKRRTVAVDDLCLAELAVWLERRAKLGLNGRHPVFCTLKGGRIHDSYIRHLLPRLARKAGIEKRVHSHGLRRTHGTHLMARGAALKDIRDQYGHSSIATTSRYLAPASAAERKQMVALLPR